MDGKNLDAGQYRALIKSGTETRKSPWQQTIDDEVEFDFDSDADDVAEGATRISQTFVKKTVKAKILDQQGFTVASDTATCRIRR